MIAHIDADCFFASVLIRKHPRLRGKALLALGMGGGCVIAASYEAKAKGVKTGMRLKDARALCPGAVEMPSDFNETALASEQIETILGESCPVMEEMSIDEWYLDLTSLVGGVPEDLEAWATMTRLNILKKTAISVSIGVGPSKLLAKMAGEYRKPAGITVLNGSGNGKTISAEAMLRDRPAAAIPGIGRRREVHTRAHGWNTAWDIACAPAEQIVQLFGKPGRDIQQELQGIVTSPVAVNDRPQQSISRARSFYATHDRDYVWAQTIEHLSYSVLKMRKMELTCRLMGIWMREGYEHSRGFHCKLPQLMATEQQLLPYLRRCFDRCWKSGFSCTQVAIFLGHLQSRSAQQLSLFVPAERYVKDANLQTSLDSVRLRYGREAIVLGGALPLERSQKRHVNWSLVGED